ncbi:MULTISPECIES: TetR/AcrR family transcriptional regulator [Bradyrhizobium]|uniref:TetR/AcrR family transcriptional regulator n=1 Tax=Bradyrhizobium vignae TaxID=1549949 RepID=A0A2U3PTJ2_9BRAD|nr:TetR/AcrR family transcriptional regulator [Bradyrhizobium vignae]MBP0115262.1 TetR/AcrR family transcriptional regulator [Bradyrhizobium vignae]SPP92462.1 conserved protein of unknown function [Bradyrhizobium vignae]
MNVHSIMHAIVFDKRERILAATAKLIVRNGLQCSMAEIASTAGVATGSLYTYFKSKDDLVRGVYAQLTEAIVAALIVEHDAATSPEARLRRYIEDYIAFVWTDADRALLFEYLSNVPIVPAAEMLQIFAPVIAFTNKTIREAREAGVLRDFGTHDMGAFIGGGLRNTLKWMRARGEELSPERRRQLAAMCWSAIAAEPEAIGED